MHTISFGSSGLASPLAAAAWLALVALAVAYVEGGAFAGEAGAESIPDDEYVRVDAEGHLVLKGVRQRYWGAIGGFPYAPKLQANDTPERRASKIAAAYADVDALVQRLVDLGFNLNRMWHGFNKPVDYVKGDGSRADIVDYFIFKMKQRGLKLWAAGINDLGEITPGDAGVIDDPATAEEWKAALGKWNNGRVPLRNIVSKWDRRFEALAIERRKTCATHLNRHTGLRWCDDPVFVVWELSNEEWWISKMVGGQWRNLPEYWQRMLFARWNEFLRVKYRTEDALRARWKSLLPGENLERGTIQLMPIAGETDVSAFGMDEQARRQLEAAQAGAGKKYRREDFARERGEDVLEFFVKLHVESKRREAEALRRLGKSTRLCPIAWDTGIGYEIQAQYMHQESGVSCHDAYVNGWGWFQKPPQSFRGEHDRRLHEVGAEAVAPNRGPWNCWLLKPPGICQGVPWLEHNKIEGRPYLCYETQIQQPAKYRADFPLRLGMLASIQDWDAVCWHYYAPPEGIASKERPFDQTLDVTVGGHPQGYHFTFDEVQAAMMRAAGLIWRQGLLEPAQRPTKFIYGRKSLYDPASMDYGHSYGRRGLDMLYTVYQYGVRIWIDPSREEDQVIGPVVSFDDRHTHNPYTPTKQLTLDWKKGYLVYDAPGAVAFAGFLPKVGGKYAFKNGVELSGVDIHNPPGIYDPVTNEEGYIAFALYSEDGAPLAKTRSAALSLVSTSFNTGFSLSKKDFEGLGDSPLAASARPNREWGRLPVLVARVAATVRSRALDGMAYTMLDWHMKPVGDGRVTRGELKLPNDKPVFVVKLSR